MIQFQHSLPATYFDDLYATDPDPWKFVASPYEREKYVATLSAFPTATYAAALEIGCSIGVLTRELAARCDALLAVDIAKSALDHAARRCADLAHVRFALAQVPRDWPSGCFDLILLSEVVYYLDRADVEALVLHVGRTIATGGDIVLVHWLGETHYPLSGDAAADLFIGLAASFADVFHQARYDAYRLDVLRARDVNDRDMAG